MSLITFCYMYTSTDRVHKVNASLWGVEIHVPISTALFR